MASRIGTQGHPDRGAGGDGQPPAPGPMARAGRCQHGPL